MRKNQLQEYLKKHCVGKKRVVSAGTLALALNMHEKELRKLVNRLRREGVPIASGREGYYYASNAGEGGGSGCCHLRAGNCLGAVCR